MEEGKVNEGLELGRKSESERSIYRGAISICSSTLNSTSKKGRLSSRSSFSLDLKVKKGN